MRPPPPPPQATHTRSSFISPLSPLSSLFLSDVDEFGETVSELPEATRLQNHALAVNSAVAIGCGVAGLTAQALLELGSAAGGESAVVGSGGNSAVAKDSGGNSNQSRAMLLELLWNLTDRELMAGLKPQQVLLPLLLLLLQHAPSSSMLPPAVLHLA